ncbi:hypothetical protein NLI96_g5394 [Meripilus lineatus]|uniref:Uncharacterized protein n=1 Tax=Meripilus lineatus TaxID=2056292 RepID=A0AAD5YGZ7_9APHY|nr:hypothetical protein NLI96_g5394 [Physisporinus lineatus]
MLRFTWRLTAVILSLCKPSRLQNFSIPTLWRKPYSDYTRSDLDEFAQGIINVISPQIADETGLHPDLDFYQNANFILEMAYTDYAKPESFVLGIQVSVGINHYFSVTKKLILFRRENPDALAWSLATHAAYRAYLLPEFLTLAINIWDSVSLYQITQENATNGSHPLKQHTFQSTCNGGIVILPKEL